jgi:hypothetical protein
VFKAKPMPGVATDEKRVRFPGCHFPNVLFREYKLSKEPDSHYFLGRALSCVVDCSFCSFITWNVPGGKPWWVRREEESVNRLREAKAAPGRLVLHDRWLSNDPESKGSHRLFATT